MLRGCSKSTPKRIARARLAAKAVAAAVMLAGCGPGGGAGGGARADIAVSQIPPPLSIGPSGAMALRASAPYAAEALAPYFPGLELIEGQTTIERQVRPVTAVRSDGMVVFEIFPAPAGMVGSVITRSPAVAGPLGEVVGSTRLRDLPQAETAVCLEETRTGERRQVCGPTPNAPFQRVFRPANAIEPPKEGAARLETLAGGDILVEMRWMAPTTP